MCVRAVDDWQQLGLPHDVAALLLSTVDEPGETGAAAAASVARLMTDAGALAVDQAIDPAEIDRLFLARRLAYPALERLGPVLTEDICVPRTRGARDARAGSATPRRRTTS